MKLPHETFVYLLGLGNSQN